MAGVKVVNFPAATPILSDIFPFIDDPGGTPIDSKVTFAEIVSAFSDTKSVLSSAYTNSTTTGTEVTGLSQTLVAGSYRFSYFLLCQSAATTTALDFGINYTGTMTAGAFRTQIGTTGAAAATGVADGTLNTVTGNVMEHWSAITESTTAPNMGAFAGVATANENFLVVVEGILVVSNGGDLELWVASEVGSSQVTVGVGSNLLVTRF
jgi:hypothetical protein